MQLEIIKVESLGDKQLIHYRILTKTRELAKKIKGPWYWPFTSEVYQFKHIDLGIKQVLRLSKDEYRSYPDVENKLQDVVEMDEYGFNNLYYVERNLEKLLYNRELQQKYVENIKNIENIEVIKSKAASKCGYCLTEMNKLAITCLVCGLCYHQSCYQEKVECCK